MRAIDGGIIPWIRRSVHSRAVMTTEEVELYGVDDSLGADPFVDVQRDGVHRQAGRVLDLDVDQARFAGPDQLRREVGS
jgi:hypothetical protein